MIVNHRHRYVYLHVPKTGGTSVTAALGLVEVKEMSDAVADAAEVKYDYRWEEGFERLGRSKHHVVAAEIPPGYFVFSFVRNPWDRIMSYYLYRHGEPRTGDRRSIHPDERRIGFKEWLGRIDEFQRWRRATLDFRLAVSSQWELLGDLPEFVGRYERLDADFGYVCERLGLPRKPLRNVNPTTVKTRPYWEYYDEESRDLVAARYAQDIAHYGYTFDAPGEWPARGVSAERDQVYPSPS